MISNKPKPIPNCLRKWRMIRGLKQREVAAILGLNHANIISKWESGISFPSPMNIIRLAALYRTMIDALYIDVLKDERTRVFQSEAKYLSHSQASYAPGKK